MAKQGAYKKIIEEIFFAHYKKGETEFLFEREEIADTAQALGLDRPKNLGDVVYSFRFRTALPQKVLDTQPKGLEWLIWSAGDAVYKFKLGK